MASTNIKQLLTFSFPSAFIVFAATFPLLSSVIIEDTKLLPPLHINHLRLMYMKLNSEAVFFSSLNQNNLQCCTTLLAEVSFW